MRGFGFGAAAAATIAATSMLMGKVVADVDPIVIKGSKFFYKSNGTQFFMRGVAYQQDYSANGTSGNNGDYKDPLTDEAACSRDIPVLQQIQTNVIRVYALDPEKNHDACMTQLQDAGIYVVADLSQPDNSINRNDPTWNDKLYARYAAVVDAMAPYSNTLGFFAGNEVSNEPNNTAASAFVKAAVRDTKAYIKKQDYRPIGVGYATNDDANIREDMADYFDCGETENAIDFWGYNIYSWCGDSSYSKSGYDVRTKEFSTYNVPVFFAEYGCNEGDEPRLFSEVGALFGEKMTPVWSGGIVYMYFQEENDYGLVKVDGDSVSKLPDYTSLSSQLAKVTPTGVNMGDYQPSNSAAACPSTGDNWNAVASPLPPTPNQELCSCMYQSLTCVVSSDADEDNYGELFGTVCGLGDGSQCDGIAANGSTGVYGAYGMCNSTEQLAFAMDSYYQAQSGSNQASACDFDGAASTKSAASPTGNCKALMSEAGAGGTGTVTSSPSGTGAGDADSGSGSGGSGSDSSSSEGAASYMGAPTPANGLWQAGSLIFIAVLSGFGMILL